MLAFFLSMIEDHDNEDKFTNLYHTYQSYMMTVANAILHHPQDAEDAVQNAWIAIIRNIDKIEDIHSDKTKRYITVAIKNHSCNMLEKKKNIPITETVDLHHVSDHTSPEELSAEYQTHSEYELVLQFILDMDEKYRDVLSLYYLDECKPSEIAVLLDRPLATVKSQLQRGKNQIMQFYKENT